MEDEAPPHTEIPRDPAPSIPEIQDEAGRTPMWVPALGLGLLLGLTLVYVTMSAFGDAQAPESDAATAPTEGNGAAGGEDDPGGKNTDEENADAK